MNLVTRVFLGTVALAAFGAAAWKAGALDFLDGSSGAIAACEKVTKGALKSPSSYRRVSAQYVRGEPLTLEEFREMRKRTNCPVMERGPGCRSHTETADALIDHYVVEQELKRLGIRDATRKQQREAEESALKRNHALYQSGDKETIRTGSVVLEYDADNSFGASLRSESICRFGPVGDDGEFEPSDIILFGEVPRNLAL